MKDGRDLSEDLDLSFLSNEEEMAIRQVLLRDENLRRQETGRIRRLRLSIPDPKKLKIMTGEWFEELRTRRHGRQSDVTEVVRSSMRRKKTAAPRANPYLDTRKTDNKGENKKIDSLITSGKTLNTSFLNPAFREEKVKLELSDKERTAYTDVTTVDIPEWKTPPLLRPSEQTSREELGPNPSLSTQHQDIDYFSTAKQPGHSSPKVRTLRTLKKASIPVGDQAPESLSTLTTRSDPGPPAKPEPVLQDDVTYLESTRILVLPPEIKDDLGQRSPVVSVDPNTWIQPVVEDKFVGVDTKDKVWAPEKPKRLTLSRDEKLGRSEDQRFAEGHSKPQSVSTLSVSIWEGSDQIKPQPKQEKFRAGYKISVEKTFSGDMGSSSEERINPGSGDVEGFDRVEVSSITSTVGGTNQESAPHLDEVKSKPYSFKTTKHVSEKDRQEPKPVETESHSELAFRSPQPAPGYNPFSTTNVSIYPEGQSLQEKSHDPVEPKTWTQPVVEDNIIKINTTDKDLIPEITTGVTSTSKEDTEDSVITKTKSTIPAEAALQEANQGAGRHPIPTILVSSSQPSATEEGVEPRKKLLNASTLGGPSLGNLEDEAMDSDEDDHSSVSSMGSDLSDRRGYGSTLSISGRTGSMLSVYSDAGDFGNVNVQGAVEFALRYSKEGEFIVTVEQCLDLAFANARKQRTDPYVKTYLYPDKSRNSKKKTSIKKRTNNPVYGGETLKYKIKMEELTSRTLNLSVWHNDSRGRNVFLGQVEINLKTWDWDHEALTWYNLLPKSSEGQESTEPHGLLTVALKYIPPGSAGNTKPDSGEFHVWLKEARELRRLKSQGVDSFVKCYMLPDTSKKSRQKTRVVKKSQEPVYNHAMVYDGFRKDEIREACCELTVWDQNKLSNQFLGGTRLSLGTGKSYGKKVDWMDSLNQEIELWEKMLESPNNWVEGEIPLRSAMTPRK